MTNTEEKSERYFRLLADSDAKSEDISRQIVGLLRLLFKSYPGPVTDPLQVSGAPDINLAARILEWLKSEHMVKLEDDQVWLTLTGSETIRAVCQRTSAYQKFFEDPENQILADPTDLVLALLRTHFEGGRSSGH